MGQNFKVGTRASPLALKQAEEIVVALKKFYPKIQIEIVKIETYGDKDKTTPISETEGTDFFTREIDEALLKGEIDFAVHSAKDLADNLRDGLTVAAITNSIDPYDVLVSKSGLKLDELPYKAKIGTSSQRRKTQLEKFKEDFQIMDIRGNIEERLDQLNKSDLDAIVIACAGLVRLGLEDKITQRIPFEIIKPHPLQGALAVVVRRGNQQLFDLLSVIDVRKEVCYAK